MCFNIKYQNNQNEKRTYQDFDQVGSFCCSKENKMKEKIDFSKCIRTDCKRCNQFKICFKEGKKKKNEKNMDKTKCNKLY